MTEKPSTEGPQDERDKEIARLTALIKTQEAEISLHKETKDQVHLRMLLIFFYILDATFESYSALSARTAMKVIIHIHILHLRISCCCSLRK